MCSFHYIAIRKDLHQTSYVNILALLGLGVHIGIDSHFESGRKVSMAG